VWVSDEHGPAIREHRIADGAPVAEIALPAIFSRARLNLSLESLALQEDGALWTANEEALRPDGHPASESAGTLVRLQRFAPDGEASGQWAYRTDPFPGKPLVGLESSGVVELVALPEGGLLALERAFSNRGFRSRIYEVRLEQATETSALPSLTAADLRPVGKRLLWERSGLPLNFEGAALGPGLADGWRSLLLVSDDGGLTEPHLYPLRVGGLPAAAGPPGAGREPAGTGDDGAL
jgi:hypothetical protein